MAIAKMTLYGMARWMADHDDNLFEFLTTPDGMDADHLIDVILYRGAEFGVVYSDPDFMKMMIGIWSQKHEHTFERWVNALSIEYNPLENYDRREEWDDSNSRVKSGEQSRTGTDTKNSETTSAGTESVSHTEDGSQANEKTRSAVNTTATNVSDTVDTSTSSTKGSNTDTQNTVSAFDSSTMQNDTRSVVDGSESNAAQTKTQSANTTEQDGSYSEAEKNAVSDSRSSEDTRTKSDALKTSDSVSSNGTVSDNETEAAASKHTGRTRGNIGVTTSQQMLLQEWEVAKLNIYEEASDLFLSEFCIYTY